MMSRTGLSRSASRTAACLLTGLLLMAPAAQAFPFFGNDEPEQASPFEELPPTIEPNPGLTGPAVTQPLPSRLEFEEPLEEPPPPQTPQDTLQELVQREIFPPALLERQEPITRAEFAMIMARALAYNMELYSEFPFYIDVPRDYWAYVPIEVARQKGLIVYPESDGYYQPDQPVLYGTVYRILAHALAGAPPPFEAVERELSGFENWQDLSLDLQRATAEMARNRFFEIEEIPQSAELMDEAVTPRGLAPLVAHLLRVVEHHAPVVAEAEAAGTAVLPADLDLAVTPDSAIFEGQILMGATYYFSLVYAVDPLPKGSRFKGTVRSIMPEAHTYVIELTEVETPSGRTYQTSAEISLIFPPEDKLSFVVPGEVFETTTRIPLGTPEPAMPVPQLAQPEESSGSTSGPNFVPRSLE